MFHLFTGLKLGKGKGCLPGGMGIDTLPMGSERERGLSSNPEYDVKSHYCYLPPGARADVVKSRSIWYHHRRSLWIYATQIELVTYDGEKVTLLLKLLPKARRPKACCDYHKANRRMR